MAEIKSGSKLADRILATQPISGFYGLVQNTSLAYDRKGKVDELSAPYTWIQFDRSTPWEEMERYISSESGAYFSEGGNAHSFLIDAVESALKTDARNARAKALKATREEEIDPLVKLTRATKALAGRAKKSGKSASSSSASAANAKIAALLASIEAIAAEMEEDEEDAEE